MTHAFLFFEAWFSRSLFFIYSIILFFLNSCTSNLAQITEVKIIENILKIKTQGTKSIAQCTSSIKLSSFYQLTKKNKKIKNDYTAEPVVIGLGLD